MREIKGLVIFLHQVVSVCVGWYEPLQVMVFPLVSLAGFELDDTSGYAMFLSLYLFEMF